MFRPVVVGLDGSPGLPVPGRLGSVGRQVLARAPPPSHHDAFRGRCADGAEGNRGPPDGSVA